MMIIELKQRNEIENKRFSKAYTLFGKLLEQLRKKQLPDHIVHYINADIETLNAIKDADKELKKQLIRKQNKLLELLEKELKLVTKNSYRNKWMVLGMTFGIPFGAIFGTALGNMAFLGIGLPIGMAIGLAIGGEMDKKAAKEGRQLDIEIEV